MKDKNKDLLVVFQGRLRWAMAHQGWSARKTSLESGLSESYVKKILAKKSLPGSSALIKLAKALKVEGIWLVPDIDDIDVVEIGAAHEAAKHFFESHGLTGEDKSHALEQSLAPLSAIAEPTREAFTHMTQIVGEVTAGAGMVMFEDQGLDVVETPPNARAGTVAARITGNSFYPLLKPGSLIFWSQRRTDLSEFINELVLCHIEDGRKAVKILTRGSAAGTYTLISSNADPIEDVRIESVSPIDWMRR